jgi:hypothetical protein
VALQNLVALMHDAQRRRQHQHGQDHRGYSGLPREHR